MNILLVAGLLVLSQSLYVYSVDDLPVSSTNSRAEDVNAGEKEFLSTQLDTPFNTNTETSTNSIEEFSEKINSLVVMDETLKELSSICSVLDSSLKEACIQIVSLQNQQEVLNEIMKNGHLEGLYEVIEDYYKDQNNSLNENKSSTDYAKNPIICITCKLLMNALKGILSHNPTRKTIRNALAYVCNVVPKYVRGKCQYIIYRYFGQIFNFLVRRISPSQICRLIMLCTSDISDEEMRIMDIVLSRKNEFDDSNGIEKMKDIKEIEIKKDISTVPLQNGPGEPCQICKTIVERLEQEIYKFQIPERVQKHFLNICELFNSNIKTQCIKFFNGPGLEVIKAVLKTRDPKMVCQIISLCPRSESYSQYLELFDIKSFEGQIERSCKMCMKSITWLEKNINPSKTTSEVQKVFLGFCGIFKYRAKTFCTYFFSSTGPGVIDGILKKKDSKKICQMMYLCRYRVTESSKNEEKSTNSIQGFLEKDYSFVDTDEILKNDNSICSVLGSPLKDICTKIMSLESHQEIAKLMDNGQLEDLYNVIENYYKEINDSIKKKTLPQDNTEYPIACYLCKRIMKKLGKILSRYPTKSKIKKALGKVCYLFHDTMKRKCENFVDKYSDKIIKYVLRNNGPQILCKLLLLCSNDLIVENLNIMDIHMDDKNTFDDSLHKKEIKNLESEIKKDGPNPVGCLECEGLMKEIGTLILNKKSKKEIELTLRKVCHLLPGYWRAKYERFVEKYRDKMVEFFMDDRLPSKICSSLQLCSTNDDT